MDSSTTVQCREMEVMLGGAEEVARRTGSRAYEVNIISETKGHEHVYSNYIVQYYNFTIKVSAK